VQQPGLPDGIFSNQNPNLGKFWRVLVYFVVVWYTLWSFGIFFRLGILYEEKSGNTARDGSEKHT
jgi:hypothetical protein